MARIVNSSEVSSAQKISTATTQEMVGGATGPITKVISERRSHRHQWRIVECAIMVILDALMLYVAFHLAYKLRYDIIPYTPISHIIDVLRSNFIGGRDAIPPRKAIDEQFALLEICVVAGLLMIFASRRLYNFRLTGSWFRQVWAIGVSTTIGMAVLITYFFFFPHPNQGAPLAINSPNSRILVPFIWVATILVLSIGRLFVSWVIGMLHRMGMGETRVLVVGSGRLGKMVMQCMAASPDLGYAIVGFLHDLNEPPGDFGRFKMLGTINDIGMVIRSMHVDEVIIALPANMHQHAIRSVKLCERLGASFKLIPDLYEMNLSRIDMEALEGIPLIGIKQVSLNRSQRFITRLIDICVSASVLLVGLPLWLCVALIIHFTSDGPIIFKQTRVGLNGQLFSMYKFRSMYKDADQRVAQLQAQNEAQGPLFKMKEDPRITPVGKFIRRTSLDEVLQLVNILKGDMSLVGPRPPLPREVALYEEWQKGRLAIKPGLTGLWQVRGRSDISFDEGVLMDLYYIENWSLRLYIQILLRTIPAVLFSRGAY
ncbi:MAG: sugar transferase [Ktedonobacteraceae bacterium]